MKKNKLKGLLIVLVFTVVTTIGCSKKSEEVYREKNESNTEKHEEIEENKEEELREFEKVDYKSIDKIVESGYEEVEAYLDEQWKKKEFQGVALVAEGDKVTFAKAYGYADMEEGIENTLTTRFAIASNTKQITAVGILQLVEAGKINLNDTIDKYFPEYKHGKDITVKDLLQMRSGILDYINSINIYMKSEESKEILDSYREDIYFDRFIEDERWTSDIILENLYLNELIGKPKEDFAYSNTNYYLLGLIIEKASGMAYEDYIEKNIFELCNMESSNMVAKEKDAKGHGNHDSGEIVVNPDFTFSAGNVYATAIDLLKWNRMLHGGEILGDNIYRQMITPNGKYGYGVFIENGIIRHGGAIDGFRSNTQYDRENDRTIIILENKDNSTGEIDAKRESERINLLIK